MSDLSSILDIESSTAAVTTTTAVVTSASSSSTSITSTSSTSLITSTPATTANTSSISQESSSSTSTSISSIPTTTSFSLTTSTLNTPTTSSTSTSTPSSSSSTSLSPTSSVHTSVNSSGGTETVTVVNSVTPTASASLSSTSTSAASGSSSSFFSNKGAVAGTFTVVGIFGAVILIWGIIYFVRRRRANKYDRESEEAALEAAHATAPIFLDDDDDRPTYGSYSNTGATHSGYEGGANYGGLLPSASSHGTYAQPFMGLSSNENYPMAQFGSQSSYPAFMTSGASPQRNNYFDYEYASAEGHTSPPTNTARPLSGAYSIPEMPEHHDGVDGASNIGMSMAYGGMHPSMNRGQSTLTSTGSHSQTDLSRNKSQGSRSLVDSYNSTGGHEFAAPTSNESYAAHYQPGFSRMTSSATPSRRSTIAYDEAPPLPNPFTRTVEDGDGDDSDEEVQHPQKILKVANE